MLMAEFATCVKYQLPVKVFVIKNNTLGMIKWEQMVFLGNPEYACDLHPIDFAAFAHRMRRGGIDGRRPPRLRPGYRTGVEYARPSAGASSGRSIRAADASQGHLETGS
jgi:thiamine pyrophosphate-dependent acetolactate synthase large subunit-like protein